MAVFIGTFENKIDRKSRVSVPAPFRRRLEGQSFNGIVAFPSHRDKAIECSGMDFVDQLTSGMDSYELFSEQHSALSTSIFADGHELAFDIDGRIIIPQELLDFAGITDRVAFVGKGRLFQIWEPTAAAEHKQNARKQAESGALTVPLQPNGGPS